MEKVTSLIRLLPRVYLGDEGEIPLRITAEDLNGIRERELRDFVRWCDACKTHHFITDFLVHNEKVKGRWELSDDPDCSLCYRHYLPKMDPIVYPEKPLGGSTPPTSIRIVSLVCGNQNIRLFDPKNRRWYSIQNVGTRTERHPKGPLVGWPKEIRMQPRRNRSEGNDGRRYGKKCRAQ